MLTFRVPGKPCGVNQAYKPIIHGRRVSFGLTDEGKAYKETVHAHAINAAKWKPAVVGPYEVRLRFAFETWSSDVDGPIKPTLDGIAAAGILPNDNRVVRLTAEKTVERGNPGVTAWVLPASTVSPWERIIQLEHRVAELERELAGRGA